MRVSTSEEEVVASARALSGKLAGKVVEIRQSYTREIVHLEDKVNVFDVETMTEAAVAVVMFELNGNKLIRKVIEPETGERWAVMYLFTADDYMCILYTPEMTYLDKYDPITGGGKETLVSPMLMDTFRAALYQNRTRKTTSVQTDIQLTDSFEVSDDGEETKTAGNLASRSLFVPFLRRTIMKEKNREIEFGRKTVSGSGESTSPNKPDIHQIIAEKTASGRASVGSSGLFSILRGATSVKDTKPAVQDTPLTGRTNKSEEKIEELRKDDQATKSAGSIFPLAKGKQESPLPKESPKTQETRKPSSSGVMRGEESARVQQILEVPLGMEQSEPQSPDLPKEIPKPAAVPSGIKPGTSAGSSIFGGERKSVALSKATEVKEQPAKPVTTAKAPANPIFPSNPASVRKQTPVEEEKPPVKAPTLDSSDSEESFDQMRGTAKPLSPPPEIVEVKPGKRPQVQAAAVESPPQIYSDVYEEHKDFTHVARRYEGNFNQLNENESLGSDEDEEEEQVKAPPGKCTTKLNIIPPADSEPYGFDEEKDPNYDEEEEEYDVNVGPEQSSSEEGSEKETKKPATKGKSDEDDEDFKPTVKVPSKPRDDCTCAMQ